MIPTTTERIMIETPKKTAHFAVIAIILIVMLFLMSMGLQCHSDKVLDDFTRQMMVTHPEQHAKLDKILARQMEILDKQVIILERLTADQ